jgi:hypothetical protein
VCGESVAQREIDRAGDLLARAGAHGAAQRARPAFGADRARVEAEVGEDSGVVDMPRDLLGAALRRDVLGTDEAGVPVFGRDAQQVVADDRDRAPCALLPRSVGRGVHDDLADDAPAGVPGLAARDEESGQRVRDDGAVGLRAVCVEMPEGLGDTAAGGDGSGQLQCCALTPAP